jgi:hypothetical protein
MKNPATLASRGVFLSLNRQLTCVSIKLERVANAKAQTAGVLQVGTSIVVRR